MAQLAEQLICNQQVIGSSPIIGLRQKPRQNYPEEHSVDGGEYVKRRGKRDIFETIKPASFARELALKIKFDRLWNDL